MTYSAQTFSVAQVLTAAQMNQVETNIKDHIHGDGTVGAQFTALYGGNATGIVSRVSETPILQAHVQSVNSGLFVARWQGDANGVRVQFAKSRHGTIGSHTIVQDGDVVMSIEALGSDGSDFDQLGRIEFVVDGTPGAGSDMPGRFRVLVTPDASATPVEQFRLHPNGNVRFPGHGTTANAANTHFDSATGLLSRSTSSARFKDNIRDLTDDEVVSLLRLRPRAFTSLASADDPTATMFGFVSEEVAAVAPDWVEMSRPLKRLVHNEIRDLGDVDVNGDPVFTEVPGWAELVPDEAVELQPERWKLDAILAALVGVVQRHEARLTTLESGG